MSGQLNEFRLQVERLDYDNKESIITIDIVKEQNQDAKNELEELKKTIADLKAAQKDASAEDKEKRKQEKMALMMAKFDAVRALLVATASFCTNDGWLNSKAPSLRRTSSFVRFWPNSKTRAHPCPTTTSSPSVDSSLRARLFSAIPSTASVRLRRRMRCTPVAAMSSRLVSPPSRPSTRSFLVRVFL